MCAATRNATSSLVSGDGPTPSNSRAGEIDLFGQAVVRASHSVRPAKGKAEDDPRHLWPHWFRLIREQRPERIFGEQVANGVGKGWWDVVSTELEAEAYTVGAVVLGAHSVGAPHLRQRIWWVADSQGARDDAEASRRAWRDASQSRLSRPSVADANHMRKLQSQGSEPHKRGRSRNGGATGDATGSRLSDRPVIAVGESAPQSEPERPDWWATEPAVGRLAHGIRGRVGRLRGYGNAIVPQVAASFVSAYLECAP